MREAARGRLLLSVDEQPHDLAGMLRLDAADVREGERHVALEAVPRNKKEVSGV